MVEVKASGAAFRLTALTIIFWSTVATAFKLTLGHISFLPLVFYASLCSVMVLVFLCLLRGKFSELSQWHSRDVARSVLLGVLNPALYYLLLFRAYSLLPAQVAQVLNFTWPILLLILGAVFLKQRLTWASLIAITVSFLGVVIVSMQGSFLSIGSLISGFSFDEGVALALISAVVWAGYWVVNQADNRDPLLRLCINFIAGLACLSIVMTLTKSWQWPSAYALLGAAYIGLFEMSLAFYCWLQALRLSNNKSLTTNLVFLTPFLSLVLIGLVLEEPIHSSTLWGLMMIIGSILFQRMMEKNRA